MFFLYYCWNIALSTLKIDSFCLCKKASTLKHYRHYLIIFLSNIAIVVAVSHILAIIAMRCQPVTQTSRTNEIFIAQQKFSAAARAKANSATQTTTTPPLCSLFHFAKKCRRIFTLLTDKICSKVENTCLVLHFATFAATRAVLGSRHYFFRWLKTNNFVISTTK